MRRFSPWFLAALAGVGFLSACGKTSTAKAVNLSAGGSQTCVLQNGTAKCWGKDDAGQLGDWIADATGQLINPGGGNQNVPVAVTIISEKLTAVSMGYVQTCGLTETGDIFCWGTPIVEQSRFSTAGGFVAVTAGSAHACGLTSGGAALCWGKNALGGLGDGSTETRSEPVPVIGLERDVASLSAGQDFTCAVQRGAVKCWGLNDTGQLGNGTYERSLEAAAVSGLDSGFASVVAGVFHTCALKSNGELWCWGDNMAGALGDGTNQSSLVPVKVAVPQGGYRAVAVGAGHTCALTDKGGVQCWGANTFGQLGDGSTTDRNAPVDVSGLTAGVAAVAAGASHTCALMASGAVKCWGANDSGQLGNGTSADSAVPVDVRL